MEGNSRGREEERLGWSRKEGEMRKRETNRRKK